MARNAFVIAKRRKREFRPFRCVAQVDVILARHLAVDRSRGGIAARRAGFDRGRHALDDQAARDHRREGARQAGANVGDAAIEIGQQLLAAGRGVRVKLRGILAERRHALADRAAGQPLLLHDRFHPRLDFLDLVEAELVDVLGRAGGRRASLQRPAIISVAVLEVPNAGVGRRGRAMRFSSSTWRCSAGMTFVAIDLRHAVDQLVVRQAGLAHLPLEGREHRGLVRRFPPRRRR